MTIKKFFFIIVSVVFIPFSRIYNAFKVKWMKMVALFLNGFFYRVNRIRASARPFILASAYLLRDRF
jgi:hypothetical protein